MRGKKIEVWKTLHIEELHKLYSPLYNIAFRKPRSMGFAMQLKCMEE